LLSVERVEIVDGELVIVMELADLNLRDLQSQYQGKGQTGIPRQELRTYLSEAAETIAVMNLRHGPQHLDIKPHNLFLTSNREKVGYGGLVESLENCFSARRNPLPQGGMSPLYAAPERFAGAISRSSDQYSLAIVYQELLPENCRSTARVIRDCCC